MNISLDIKCSRCYKIFKAELPLTPIGYAKGVAKCPHCNTLYHIRIDTRIIRIDVTQKDLDDFEQWLIAEKKLVSAHQYRKQVEKYIATGELPKKTTALNHFREYMKKKKKHRELPLY